MLDELVELLRPYDVADLLASAGALQICPENADSAIRLAALTHVIASLPYEEGKPLVSLHKLRRLCNNPPLSGGSIQSAEDPCDQPFSEAFTFMGGTYIVFPGNVNEPTFILRHLNQAVFFSRDLSSNTEFSRKVKDLNISVLSLSHEIARRAGVPRNQIPPRGSKRDIVIPRNLEDLKKAVTFSPEEIATIVERVGIPADILFPFITEVGSAKLGDYTIESSPLDMRPLVRANGKIIVGQPAMLLPALWHRILLTAKEMGLIETLAVRYREAVWHGVAKSLERFGHSWVNIPLPEIPENTPLLDGVFTLDRDKAIYVLLLTDDFQDYQEDQVFGLSSRSDMAQLMQDRQVVAEQAILQNTSGLNQICVLYLHAGVGRSSFAGWGEPPAPLRSPRLVMAAADLEIISLLEADNPLLLLKYAEASDRIRQSAKVLAFSTLDEFVVFRDSKYSYYFSDDARPKAISFTPGGGGKLRWDVAKRFDFHALPSYRRGYSVEVASVYGVADIPIYTPLSELGKRVSMLVEGLPVPIWIVGHDGSTQIEGPDLSRNEVLIADMITYWLWQFTPELAAYLDPLSDDYDVLVVYLDLAATHEWLDSGNPAVPLLNEAVQYQANPDASEVTLRIQPSVLSLLSSPDNRGERLFMGAVLEALGAFLEQSGFAEQANLLKLNSQRLLDKYAPLGTKKKVIILQSNTNPQLMPGNTPAFRKVQDADVSEWLDLLGNYLTQEVGLPEGPIRDDGRNELLNKVVAFFYNQLEKLVATLSPDGLVEYLVAHGETIVFERANRRLTIPTQLACFGLEQDLVEQLSRQLPEIYEAAIANRFLIEYVVARPPRGLRPISLSVYDQLLSLASQIVNWAYESDMIRYGIVDIRLTMLRSRRLGADRRIMREAQETFLSLKSRQDIAQASEFFGRHWRDHERDQSSVRPGWVAQVDRAFEVEFGLMLSEVTTLINEVGVLGEESKEPVKKLEGGVLTERLVQSIGWPEQKVAKGISFLSLQPRNDFLAPPAPFRHEDVYPWRFGRLLSYMWRPLLQVAEGDKMHVYWGTRHLFAAHQHIVDICLGGRLQARAKSREMQVLLGKIHEGDGRHFNQIVACVFGGVANLIVRTRVLKIGKLRIGTPGNDLGDIDVLVIAPKKHRILAVECKDLAIALTPYEMASELDELFRGAPGKESVAIKHQRRCDWLQKNLQAVLTAFDVLTTAGKWKIEPIVIVSEEMFTPHLYSPPFPVFSLRQFQAEYLPEFLKGA